MNSLPLVRSLLALTVFAASLAPARPADFPPLPAPWHNQDFGAVIVAGSARATGDVFTLQGTLDIWGTNDACHFVWQKLNGDTTLIARVLSVQETQNHAKGGITIRESPAAGARHVTLAVTPRDGAQFLVRAEDGGATTSQKTGLAKGKMPYWIKLVRIGDQFTGYESTDGTTWTTLGATILKLPKTVHLGLVASSHQKDTLCTATFDHVSVTKGPK